MTGYGGLRSKRLWKEYSTTSDLNENSDKPRRLRGDLDYYIITKPRA